MNARRVMSVVVLTMMVMASVVVGVGSVRHNYATTRRRSSGKWEVPQATDEMGSLFQRLWPDDVPSGSPQAFLPTPQAHRPSPILPQLHENDFITDDDDYDLESSPLWQPQNTFSQRPPASLESLQHLLEGEVLPDHFPSTEQISLGEIITGDELVADNTFGGQDANQRNHYLSANDLFPSYDTPNQQTVQVKLPLADPNSFNNPELMNTDLEEEALHDVLSELGLNDNLVNNRQFPKDFLGQPPRLVNDDGHQRLPISNFLAPGQYPSSLSEQEPFLKNLFSGGQLLPSSLGKEDIFSSVDNHSHYPDQATVSDILTKQQSFQEFPQLNSLMNKNLKNGHFHGYTFEKQQKPHPLEHSDESRGPEWFSSSPFHLPSSKDLIIAHTNPELTEDGQREACHAQNLHTCGGRVIDEFTQQPKYLEPCRIREEFLDCMEKQWGRPCEVRGRGFSREDTSRIRDKVKILLWSARGCILGHSA